MFKKIIFISLIPFLTIHAEEDFDVKNVEVIEVDKKNTEKDNPNVSFLDEKAKETPLDGEQISDTDENIAEVIQASEESDLGQTIELETEKPIVPVASNLPQKELMKLKAYKNIKYSKKYAWFSLLNGKDKKSVFQQALAELRIKGSFQSIKNDVSKPKYVIANALYYDLIEQNPQLAENFYIIMYKNKDNHNFSFKWSKIILTDYLLRTGRLNPAKDLIRPTDCVIYNKLKYKCNYYLGVVDYLTTGNSRNKALYVAKKKIKKAKAIYQSKPVKKKKQW